MIDTGTLTSKITALRKLTQKNSISPEMVGAILQSITDILATAGTQASEDVLNTWYAAIKQAPAVISSLTRGSYDRNDFLANITKVSLVNGNQTTETNYTLIPQATTEHSGMMRAQQVTDLNALRTAVNSTILPALEVIKADVDTLVNKSANNSIIAPQILCEVIEDIVYVRGASKLIAAGYVPYLFRFSRRRTQDRDNKWYTGVKRGWHLFGSKATVKISSDGQLSFSNQSAGSIHMAKNVKYEDSPVCLLHIKTDKRGNKYVPWGLSKIYMNDFHRKGVERMLRLPYAIGFAKEKPIGRTTITADDLVSNLAQFSIIYDRENELWQASK
jgi:hypothetical protein